MKNKLTLLFVLGFLCACYSQKITNGEIVYHYKIVKDLFIKEKNSEKTKLSQALSSINTSIKSGEDKVSFKLVFNKIESIYKTSVDLEVEDNLEMALIFLEGKNVIYTNLEKNIQLKKIAVFGDVFIIENAFKKGDWKLENKTNKIGNYICYKAVKTITTKNSRGVFVKTITAWYTPSIPLNFGPKGYGNLPGLIIELIDNTIRYYATSIRLNIKKKILIQKPSKGIKITQKAFTTMIEKYDRNKSNNK